MHTLRTTPPAPPRPALALLTGTAATALALLLTATPAVAHDELVAASPEAGGTVAAADSVVLTYSDELLELGGGRNGVEVTDADGLHYETACAVVAGDELTSPVALGAAGDYTVAWRAVSGDGHGVAGSYTFSYRPAADAPVATGTADGPACGGTAADDAGPTAAPDAAAQGTGGAIAAGAIGAGVLLAALAAVLVVVLRLRRTADGGDR